MQECKPLTLEDFDRLEESFRFETILETTPEKVFEVFEDPESWPVWAGAIRKVTWTILKAFTNVRVWKVSVMRLSGAS